MNRSHPRRTFRCTACESDVPRWLGRCPECQAWGTVTEQAPRARRQAASSSASAGFVTLPAARIGDVDHSVVQARPTGVPEFDRALGGGLVPGAALLVAGEPGIGKSTLLLSVAHGFAARIGTALVVTGEESTGQVRLRAERLGAVHDRLLLAAETDLAAVLSQVEATSPGLLVLDSVQAVSDGDVEGVPGGVTQIRAATSALVEQAKRRNMTTILVGHVTKDGHVAGPRTLEHLVDVVLTFEGEDQTSLRLLRAAKNRFGTVDEVGCFTMTPGGLDSVADPSGLFVSRHDSPVSGTCLGVTMQGRRPMLAEIQALVASTTQGNPRRAVSGLDSARVAMMVAVTERRAQVTLSPMDIFVATVGGAKVAEPAADLAILIALASAAADRALPTGVAAIGEVGLAGEVRGVRDLSRRVAEAARLGVRHMLVPQEVPDAPAGVACIPVSTVSEALAKAFRLRLVPPLKTLSGGRSDDLEAIE